jgi:hypothetical protein
MHEVSPRVCAGPTSISRSSFSPTRKLSSPVKVSCGSASSIPLKSNAPKHRRKNAPSSPIAGACSISAAIAAGGSSPISVAVRSEATIRAPPTSWLP